VNPVEKLLSGVFHFLDLARSVIPHAGDRLLAPWLSTPHACLSAGATVHWYGKKGVSLNRKVGHITIVGATAEETVSSLSQIEPEAAKALQRWAAVWSQLLKDVKSAEIFQSEWLM